MCYLLAVMCSFLPFSCHSHYYLMIQFCDMTSLTVLSSYSLFCQCSTNLPARIICGSVSLYYWLFVFMKKCWVLLLHCMVDGNPVDSVSTFTYLGSLQSSDGYCRPDVRRRITFASSVMSSLDCIWKERRLPLPTKIRYAFILLSSSRSYSMPPRHGLSY